MSNIANHVREHPRTPVDIVAECLILSGVSAGGQMSEISITNISIGGCHIRADPGYLSDDCEVAIRFGDLATVRGRICWRNEIDFGVRFLEKLSPSFLKCLVETSRTKWALRSVA